ncbi:hypothetical protein NXW13_13980 [Bacteroides thetaiotaomicron]|nr:hypothetical protein [Bacteroides thetaiotaomicron]
MSKDRGANILAAIQQMAMDNNQGLRMTTTLVNVTEDQRGSIVGFGTEKEMSDDAKFQIRTGMPGEYLACAFFIKRSELKNTWNMNRIRWFVIGLHLYVFPPEPEVGDIEALHNWIPQKKGIIETLKFRFHTGIWSYTAGNINYQY